MHARVVVGGHIPPCWVDHWGGRVGHWVRGGVAWLRIHPGVKWGPGGQGCWGLLAPGYFDPLLAKRVAVKSGDGGGGFLVGLRGGGVCVCVVGGKLIMGQQNGAYLFKHYYVKTMLIAYLGN